MRIAYLFSRFPVLSQTFCVTEIRALEEQGCELVIGAIHPPETLLRHPAVLSLRAPVLHNPDTARLRALEREAKAAGRWPDDLIRRHDTDYGPALKSATRARNALWFARELVRRGVTHVHVHFANRATHTALFLKRLTGLPFSFTAHAQDFMVDFPSPALLAELVREAEFVVAVSDWSRDLLARQFPFARDKILRIHNGIDLSLFTPGPPPLAEPGAPARIFSVGRLIEFKGFDTLIEACALLARRGIAFECDIAGAGPLRDALETQIRSLGLEGKVRLTGPLPQNAVLERLRRCDLFALASRTDSKGACDVLPTVVTEAMACARPVVSTTTAGIPEQVLDGVTGLLAPPDDPAAFAQAIERVISNPEQARAFGRAGLARATEMFDARAAAASLKSLFASASAGAPQSPRAPSAQAPRAPRGLVLLDEWPCAALPPETHATLASAAAAGQLRLAWLRSGAPLEQPAPPLLAALGRRPRLIELPPPADAVVLPPASVIEAAWIARGAANDEFLPLEKSLPAGFEPADLYTAARWLLALRMSVDGFGTIPLLTAGRMAGLVGWLRGQLTGARHDTLPEPGTRAAARDPGRRLAAWLGRAQA